VIIRRPGLVNGAEENNTENKAEDRQVQVFFLQESDSTVFNIFVDLFHFGKSGLRGGREILLLRIVGIDFGVNLDIGGVHFNFLDHDGVSNSPENSCNAHSDNEVMRPGVRDNLVISS